MNDFTPISATLGGLIIGVSATLLLLSHGKIAGISGIVGGLFRPFDSADARWRWAFLAGLVGAGALFALWSPQAFYSSAPRSSSALIIAGLLVGFGTRLGNGCTSGHGVCGMSRWSRRSLVATAVFLAIGMLTASGIEHWFGGQL